MGIKIGDGNKIINSNIAENIKIESKDKNDKFYDKHPWLCGIIISLLVGIFMMFHFWENVIKFIEGWF